MGNELACCANDRDNTFLNDIDDKMPYPQM